MIYILLSPKLPIKSIFIPHLWALRVLRRTKVFDIMCKILGVYFARALNATLNIPYERYDFGALFFLIALFLV